MNSTIQPSYGMQSYDAPAKDCEAKRTGAQDSCFLDLAVRASEGRRAMLEVNSAGSSQQKTERSEAEEMQLFKREFYEDLSKIVCDPTVSNAAVHISDAAFQAMKDDPEYRAQILSLLQRDLGASFAPRNCSILITVGTNLDQYRADSWPVGNDTGFHSRAKGSFWEQRAESHKKYMELQQAAAERRRMLMRLRMSGGTVSAAELLMGLLSEGGAV